MTLSVRSINFDVHDALKVARFWAAALGWDVADWSTSESAAVEDASAAYFLYFERVPEGKQAKNRLHLDLEPQGPANEAVDRLLGLGAATLQKFPGFTVMADPEGNEFCVAGATG